MTVFVTALLTDVGVEKILKSLGQGGGFGIAAVVDHFRVGEGGWIDPGTGRQRRDADETFTDLDIVLDGARTVPDRRYDIGTESFGYYEKALVAGNFSYGSGVLTISCVLLNGEYNTKDAGTLVWDTGVYPSPELWEIGLHDSLGALLAYGTFDKVTKDVSKQVDFLLRISR